ncbi:MAG: RNA polymerase sigma factor [Thermoleophilia bacterium]
MNLLRRHKQTAGSTAAEITSQFDEVYRAYLRPVYAFVAFRVGNRAAAEDITSQVFEKAWRGYPRFDPRKAAISTWLFTIARNSLTDHYRSAGRKTDDDVELPDDLDAGTESDPFPSLKPWSCGASLKRR